MKKTFISVADVPRILEQWDFKKNNVNPEEVHSGSGLKFYWHCKNNHSYIDTASHRKEGRGCPICSGRVLLKGINDLATIHPELSTEWNYKKNDKQPIEYLAGSNKKVWWICQESHEWEATIASRSKGNSGCPYCSGRSAITGFNDLQYKHPLLALEWHPSKNGDVLSSQVSEKSHKKSWWLCNKGHEWQASPGNRVLSGTNCPTCSSELRTSFPEQAIFFYISKLFPDTINRYILDTKRTEIDIYIPSINVGIEYNGLYFHNDLLKDDRKLKFIEALGVKLYRLIETKSTIDSNREEDIQVNHPVRFSSIDMALNKLISSIKFLHKLNTENIDIDSERDRMEIYGNYLSMESGRSISNTNPEVSDRWDFEKNFPLLPKQVTSGSHKKVWWICQNGHSFEDSVSHQTSGRGCPVCSNRSIIKGVNDLSTVRPDLVAEWHKVKNKITPNEVSIGSPKRVWWICAREHEWQTTVSSRTNGSGCPYCGGRNVIEGETDLATLYPKLTKTIHPIKNGDFNSSRVKPGTQLKIWWLCSEGHEWEASIANRVKGRGCPVCANRKIVQGINDLQTLNPTLTREWNYSRNQTEPTEVSIKSNKKVWWICSQGHEWEATISHRSNGTGCPVCKNKIVIKGINDLGTLNPKIAKEWNYNKNKITPAQVSLNSNKQVWWICSNGHEWQARIYNRTKQLRCPYCKKAPFN